MQERYGLSPAQLIDYKGLAGDTSDNVPGVSGIGEKTATRLLQSFGNIESIYEHLSEIEARWQQKLSAEREQAFQSKHLVTLVKDAPVALDLQAARRGQPRSPSASPSSSVNWVSLACCRDCLASRRPRRRGNYRSLARSRHPLPPLPLPPPPPATIGSWIVRRR